MRTALAFAFVSLGLVAAGCGAESEPSAGARFTGPSEPPPKLDIDGPPPAWVETGDDAAWLAYSTYCWESTCADYVDTRCGVERIPTLVVQPGETVRFHLEFEPTSLSLALAGPESQIADIDPAEVPLPAARTAEWRVYRDGPVTLVAVPPAGGDASYVVCFRFVDGSDSGAFAAPRPFLSVAEALQAAEGAPVSVQGSLLVENGKARLCSALAESYPPQCAGPSLDVKGLDPTFVKSLTGAAGVRWSERPVELTGTLAGGVLNAREPKP